MGRFGYEHLNVLLQVELAFGPFMNLDGQGHQQFHRMSQYKVAQSANFCLAAAMRRVPRLQMFSIVGMIRGWCSRKPNCRKF